MSLDAPEVDSTELGSSLSRLLRRGGRSVEAGGSRELRLLLLLLLFVANRLKDAGEARTRWLRLSLNARVVRTVDVFLLPLALLLLVDLVETRLMRRLSLIVLLIALIVMLLLRLLLRRTDDDRCRLITRVLLRLAAYVGSGG